MNAPSPITYLFTPANRPDRFAKALASAADRVILDLEDAVPLHEKAQARENLRLAQAGSARLIVRANQASSPYFEEDLAAIAKLRPSAVMLPKTESAADIREASTKLGAHMAIIAQIESARGLVNLPEILPVPQLQNIAFGHLDFALDLGAEPKWGVLKFARQELVFQARLANANPPIDSVIPSLDPSKVLRDAKRAKALGFGGKLLIHPNQIEIVDAAFRPDEQAILWASRVMRAIEAANGAGAIAVDGKMVDKPVIEAAKRILAQSKPQARGQMETEQ